MNDPFGTAQLRRHVLDAWSASPGRFREDANAEEDLALGGYRDRVVVELAQNAADAARRAGVAGHLRLTLRKGTLLAANTGAPLDAAGVESLATLRASAKRDESAAVGRFGVGFAAVVAVTDEPAVHSSTGAVRWSRAWTLDEARQLPALGDELERRDEHVPVLRLPFPAEGAPPPGFTTAVTLPLRDEAAERLVRRLLSEAGETLLLALPALHTVEIELDGVIRHLRADHQSADDFAGEVVTDVGGAVTRWRLTRAAGELDPELLAGRPTEERARPWWSVTWALPVSGDGGAVHPLPDGVPRVVHAPTPSDEPLSLPVALLASFPLDPDRRRVTAGVLADFLVERAADAYAALLRDLEPVPDILALVPGPVAAGELDAKLGRAVLARLPDTAFLPSAHHEGVRLRPRDAAVIEGPPALIEVLAPVLPGLLPAGWPARSTALGALGVRRYGLADVADLLAGLDREPSWWWQVYAALEACDSRELGALPVPLADGRMVRGARGVVLTTGDVAPDTCAQLGLRVAHPQAAHPLLRRLGAQEAGPRAVLDDPATRAAVAASYDEDNPEPVADAVLRLVAAAGTQPGTDPWLADLALPGDDGEWYPAGEMLLPDGPLAQVVADDAPFGIAEGKLVERWGEEVLEAVGVLRTFTVEREQDVALDPDTFDQELDGQQAWVRAVLARLPETDVPPLVPELVAVRDLELVDPRRWGQALRLFGDATLRPAVVEDTRVLLPDGRGVDVPSYTAWWLRRHPVVDGRVPTTLRASGSAGGEQLLAGLYEEAASEVDPELQRALGVRTSVDGLLAEPGGPDELLDRLADPAVPVGRSQLRELLTRVAGLDPQRVTPPERVRALEGATPAIVAAEDAVVVDAPDLLPLVANHAALLVTYPRAEALAEVLEVSLASEELVGEVASVGTKRGVPEAVARVVSQAPRSYIAHDPLRVDSLRVPWRVVDGEVHACGMAGLARGLAWACGRWEARFLIEAVLRDPASVDALLAEADLDA